MLLNKWKTGQRDKLIGQLKVEPVSWDVLVIGGGITGAGVAREAARRGLSVLLLEQKDFAWGTSSRSSKMVHGGLRYIAAGDIKLTKHSVEERERLMQEAPGLVDQMGYLMAHYKGGFPGPLVFNALLTVYDFFAGHRYRKYFKKGSFEFLSPQIKGDNLIGGTQFADAITDDSRLVMRVLRESLKDGAEALNYIAVKELIKDSDEVVGVVAEDEISGQQLTIKSKVVINATGAWADKLREQVGGTPKVRPARGSHLLVPSWRLPVAQAVTCMHPKDNRPIFVFPWEGRTVIGTTDLDNKGIDNSECHITREELDYLLELTDYQFPGTNITDKDVISTFAGVRPLISSGSLNPSKEKRDHSVWEEKGLISVSGGKLTTFRLIALDALQKAACRLPNLRIKDFGSEIFRNQKPTHPLFKKLPRQQQKRLTGRYGWDVDALMERASEGELQLVPGTPTLWAEIRWAAHAETVVHLDDLLLRRTRLGLLLEGGGANYFDIIKKICMDELTWDETRWDSEVSRYVKLWTNNYSLPVASE